VVLKRLFNDRRLMTLLRRLIGGFESSPGRGLPIGTLTSQHFANFYLGSFDRFVKKGLRCKGYVRYMDDCAIWPSTSDELRDYQDMATRFLKNELELDFKASPYSNWVGHGMDFLGCRIVPQYTILNRRSRVRFCRKLRALEASYVAGRVDELALQQWASALVAFTRTPGLSSWRFRQSVLESMAVSDHERPRTG
jgi:RNA-directed DNA polymerase